ncbi:MAG TPA: delta-lactam-biosynthetic de-N-acetylase [Firmicutes bacterium]|nr:delta-lactam-biosynthetic de-N-acetylase [Bacillota bacterium]
MQKLKKWTFLIALSSLLLGFISTPIKAEKSPYIGWGIPKSKDHSQPFPGEEYDKIIRENAAYYIGSPTEKIIYLTFDTGYENGNMPQILDVLKKNNVSATFFVTGHFMKENADLVLKMYNDGHIVGNHTWHHPDLTAISKERFVEELTLIEDEYEKITGQKMVKFLRPPEGHFNQNVLDQAKDMGYYTMFWSLAYIDWHVENQRGWEYAYNQVLDRIHPGAIILMHSISKDNSSALDYLIPELRKQGYEFKSLQYLLTSEQPEVID